MSTPVADLEAEHRLDQLSLGKIVQIRERLLAASARGQRVFRFESGDPTVSVAPHVLDAPFMHRSIGSIAGDWAHRVISIFSFSKSYAMPGLRVGYVVTRMVRDAGDALRSALSSPLI